MATAQPRAASLQRLSPRVPLLPHGPPSVVATLLSGSGLRLCGCTAAASAAERLHGWSL